MHEDKAKEVCHICAKEFRDLKHHILYTHQGGWATLMDKPCPEPGCKRMFRLAMRNMDICFIVSHLSLLQV